jgi:hypothetical protein
VEYTNAEVQDAGDFVSYDESRRQRGTFEVTFENGLPKRAERRSREAMSSAQSSRLNLDIADA